MKEQQYCYNCDKEFEFEYNNTYDMNDIVDGQYIEYQAIRCSYCGIENRVYYT